jgi:hypothetical protein
MTPGWFLLCALGALVLHVVVNAIQEARWRAYEERWRREHPGRRGVLK